MKKPNKKLIIALTSHPASGKGEVVKYLKNKYGAASCRFSSILRDILKRIYLEASRQNLAKISLALRERFSNEILAKVIAKDIAGLKNKIIIIDGARRYPELKYLKRYKNFHLIRVVADEKIRFQRLKMRNENPDDAKKTFKQFLKEHQLASDREVADLMKHANREIDNNGNRKNLYKQIDEIITQL